MTNNMQDHTDDKNKTDKNDQKPLEAGKTDHTDHSGEEKKDDAHKV